MEKSTNLPSNQDILGAIEDGTITLSEVVRAIKTKLNTTLISDLPLEALPLIKKFKTPPHETKVKRFGKIEEYINNINPLRNNSNKPILQEVNGKTQYFGDYRRIGELKKHGNAVFFSGKTTDHYNELVIHNGDKVKKMPPGFENIIKSKSDRNLLHVLYNFPCTLLPYFTRSSQNIL